MTRVGLRAYPSAEQRPDLIEKLVGFRSTDLCDGMRRCGSMSGIRRVTTGGPPLLGHAVTVSAPVGGFDIVKAGLDLCRRGDVLVVSARGDVTNVLWGGNLSLGAQRRGVAGFVIDGAVRDADEIDELGFPVYARGLAVSAGVIEAPYGEINVPIACGSVVVCPGDIIVGDRDGIVVVAVDDVEETVQSTRKILDGHVQSKPALEAGLVTNRDSIWARLTAGGIVKPHGDEE